MSGEYKSLGMSVGASSLYLCWSRLLSDAELQSKSETYARLVWSRSIGRLRTGSSPVEKKRGKSEKGDPSQMKIELPEAAYSRPLSGR